MLLRLSKILEKYKNKPNVLCIKKECGAFRRQKYFKK